jgi:hypothetical protein
MSWISPDIPDWFLRRYASEFAAWAANFNKIGISELTELARPDAFAALPIGDPSISVKAFVLKEGGLANLSPDPEQGAELPAVFLLGKRSRNGIEIMPLTGADRDLIRGHVNKMQRARVDPDMRLAEPVRPGLPFMPELRRRQCH